MKTQFDTEEAAKHTLNNARKENLGWCPLIEKPCQQECICYYEGDIHEPHATNKNWTVHYPCCTNVLISGVITVES